VHTFHASIERARNCFECSSCREKKALTRLRDGLVIILTPDVRNC
jgi:hypothetical protein